MSIKIIQERLDAYQCRSRQEEENALREITQEVALAALSRSDFFRDAAFQGGTCLRIFYSLERFSEDIDFVLRRPQEDFALEKYVGNLDTEFKAYGYRLQVTDRSRAGQAVKKCFLKDDSLGKVLELTHLKGVTNMRKILIKLEVDTNPPAGAGLESKFLDFPFPFSVTLHDKPSLFAGKSHALLCREYTKGRDWYDFIWYAGRGINMNWELLSNALDQQGPWKGRGIRAGKEWYVEQMRARIEQIDWQTAKEEMSRFLKPSALPQLDVWGREFFLDRLAKAVEKFT